MGQRVGPLLAVLWIAPTLLVRRDVCRAALRERSLRDALGGRRAHCGVPLRHRVGTRVHDRAMGTRRLARTGQGDRRKRAQPHFAALAGNRHTQHPATRAGVGHLKCQAVNTTHVPASGFASRDTANEPNSFALRGTSDPPSTHTRWRHHTAFRRMCSHGRFTRFTYEKSPFLGFVIGARWRRGWDSNPRHGRTRKPDFESGAFDHSATSPWPRLVVGERGAADSSRSGPQHLGAAQVGPQRRGHRDRAVGVAGSSPAPRPACGRPPGPSR